MRRKIDWQAIGDWIAVDGQIWLFGIAVAIAIVGVVFFGWRGTED